jgi:hypothetical protein
MNFFSKNKKVVVVAGVLAVSILVTAGGCNDSDAQKASENVSTAADNFEVQRKIVGINTRTDKYLFYVEGRCSIERSNGDLLVTCKQGPNDYRKHMIGGATDVAWVSTQMEGIDVSVYHTRVILKPEGIIPELELSGGKQ